MAKQTFTTGQVLTAAQMTSLQQTAMLGGAASAKTASYTLVAADAGTAISMDSASATTITVNTALFAAGDTVQITNLGAGVCTITAGTATVNTSASLALAQYESGTLDFTSTSAAIFIKGAGAPPAAGGSMTQLATGSLSSTVVNLTSIDQTYINLKLVLRLFYATSASAVGIRVNANSGATNYMSAFIASSSTAVRNANDSAIFLNDGAVDSNASSSNQVAIIDFNDYVNATTFKSINYCANYARNGTDTPVVFGGFSTHKVAAAITEINIHAVAGNLSGSYILYGVK
jgi:hypothetical protein